ncbi:hypothetical protein AMJ51_02400 [Microgenomates bacterium DG_75]|nr:MAG: hypothetical protein AMJ51_02400 [Microgenomates bacterium DG_75]
MTPEKVEVVTDSGTSIRPEAKEAKEAKVTIIPLEVKFYENGKFVPYYDLDVSPDEFYRKMLKGEKLPQTSGNVTGKMIETYKKISQKTDSIISIHITSKHSVAWESAVLSARLAQEEIPKEVFIEVIDSKQISLGTWYLTEHAAKLSQKGVDLEQIKEEVLEMIPKIQLLAVLESFENLKKGGRADDIVKAYLASLLQIYPIIGLKEGKLVQFDRARSPKKARGRMVEMVGDSGKLVRMAVLHTRVPELAREVKENLAEIYEGEIPIYEAGPVLGVHAGEGAVGIVFQKP